MATNIQDLISQLSLEPKRSRSAFGGQHRTICITKDFTNTGDFAFNNLLQHFSKKQPNTPLLLITLQHDYINYSAAAARCGISLRRTQPTGNIEVLDVMNDFLEDLVQHERKGNPFGDHICNKIVESCLEFVSKHHDANDSEMSKPVIIMIDDLSVLGGLDCSPNAIFELFSRVDASMRSRSHKYPEDITSFFIAQTMDPTLKCKTTPTSELHEYAAVCRAMSNRGDIHITIKELDTGYSTRVDGTVRVVDRRIVPDVDGTKDAEKKPSVSGHVFMRENGLDIGSDRAYFFKVSDRRVKLTTDALLV